VIRRNAMTTPRSMRRTSFILSPNEPSRTPDRWKFEEEIRRYMMSAKPAEACPSERGHHRFDERLLI
jgi:hypothetical protein